MGLMLTEPDFHTRCFVEWEKYPQQTIIAAQRAGYFAPAPIWDDVTTFDGRPFRGAFDTILAGYPCQPFSQAGQRKGSSDERHLWPDIARIIGEVRPTWVILENVSGHVTLGAETVLRDLRGLDFIPAAGLFTAAETGAAHERKRWFCVAYSNSNSNAQQFANRGGISEPDGRDHVGGCGGKDVGNAGCSERRQVSATGNVCDGNDAGRDKKAGWTGKSGKEMADAQVTDRRGQQQAGGSGRGRGGLAGSCANVADTGPAGLQRQQPKQCDPPGREKQNGSSGLHGGTGIHPPGPSDADEWRSILAVAPDLAPAASLGDIKRAANHYAQMVASGELAETQAQSRLRRMADELAARSRILKLLGNGVHPLAAANAIRSLAHANGLCPLDLGSEG